MSGRWNRKQAVLFLIAGVAASGTAFANMDAARKALAHQHYGQAASELNAVLASQPDNPEASFLKGLTLAQANKTHAAVLQFEKLTSDYPGLADAWNNLGVLYARVGRLDDARTALHKAIALNPQDASAQENMGDLYVALAERAYRSASQKEGDRASAKSQKLAQVLPTDADVGAAPTTTADTSSPTVKQRQARSPAASAAPDNASTAAPSAVKNAVASALQTWAHAWSDHDVQGYLNAYSDNYQPQGNRSLVDWIKDRRRHLASSARTEVKLSDIEVHSEGDDRAVATFDQRAGSPDHESDEHKNMLFVREDGGWRIKQES
ncbi:MAG: tetratricopeptide repeat protein [Salinisphaera sp.]|jgi:Flp pilus assembly protein TadD/ketosteroid isomerase-like protein|nr:tetratricopeptide repeat protein [Salinisphaera sp.]